MAPAGRKGGGSRGGPHAAGGGGGGAAGAGSRGNGTSHKEFSLPNKGLI